jgi:hypothetical protein
MDAAKEPPHAVASDDPLAVRLLKEEHLKLRELFDRASEEEGEKRTRTAREIALRMGIHMTIEEEILYPALAGFIPDDEIKEGIVEHQAGKTMLDEIEQLDGDEPLFGTKVSVLGEVTMHHIDEEEEEMFEEAKKSRELDLEAIGRQLEARRAELYENIARTGEEGQVMEIDAAEVETVGGGS